jgi:hypothetical protein
MAYPGRVRVALDAKLPAVCAKCAAQSGVQFFRKRFGFAYLGRSTPVYIQIPLCVGCAAKYRVFSRLSAVVAAGVFVPVALWGATFLVLLAWAPLRLVEDPPHLIWTAPLLFPLPFVLALLVSRYERRAALRAKGRNRDSVWLLGVHPDAAAAWEQDPSAPR